MVIIDNKVANKPHIYFNREKGGWVHKGTYACNGDAYIDMRFNLEARLFVCLLRRDHHEHTLALKQYAYSYQYNNVPPPPQIRNIWRVKK